MCIIHMVQCTILHFCLCPLSDDNADNVGGVDARGGPDPLTPTPGTHRLWTQPPQSQLYTHNYYNWINRYLCVWVIFIHTIFFKFMFEPVMICNFIVKFQLFYLTGEPEILSWSFESELCREYFTTIRYYMWSVTKRMILMVNVKCFISHPPMKVMGNNAFALNYFVLYVM